MASKSKKTTNQNKTKSICFTIMPFGGWFDDYYDTIYRPAIKKSGLEPKRADDLYRPSTIINDIWEYTQSAKIVLADLTGKNPNVFYELGLAHALAKPVILTTESIDEVPFDLRALRVLEYDKNQPHWGDILEQKITNSIKEIIDSPLESVLPTFLNVRSSAKPKGISEHAKEILEIKQDLDMVKRQMMRFRSDEPRRHISPKFRNEQEAKPVLIRYKGMGMPDELIIQRMVDRGAPEEWVIDKLGDMKNKQKSIGKE